MSGNKARRRSLKSRAHGPSRRGSTRIALCVATATFLSLLTFAPEGARDASGDDVAMMTPRRMPRDAPVDRDVPVLQALSEMVRLLRSGRPEVANSFAGSMAGDVCATRMARLAQSLATDPGPVVQVVSPTVTWRDGEPRVSCLLVWDVRLRNGCVGRWVDEEELLFTSGKSGYDITGSRTLVARLAAADRDVQQSLKIRSE